MSDSMLNDGLDFLEGMFKEDIIFNFFGGEPLLRPKFCIKWMKELRRRYPKCRFHLATNATRFSREFAELCTKYGSMIQLSFDGVDQDNNRGKSAEAIKNIKKYVALKGRVLPGIRLTYTRDTVGNIYDSLVMCYGLGIRKFSHHAELTDKWTDEDFKKYEEQLLKIYGFIDTHKDIYLQYCDCNGVIKDRDNSRCGAGRSLLALSTDGSLYPCHRMVKIPQFKLGDVKNKTLNRGHFIDLEILGCDKCMALSTCHPCMAANYEYNGSLIEPLRATCEINRAEYVMSEKKFSTDNMEILESGNILRYMVNVLMDISASNIRAIKELNEELAR
jgi:uncharacterized protein